MSPPPEYSHSFAQTTGHHENTSSKRLSHIYPIQDVDEDDDVNHGDIAYPEMLSDELIHPPDFRPFFTLIEDPESREHHHPGIHYIFSDDDPAFLTSAMLDKLSLQDDESHSVQPVERLVVLDIGPDGKTVIEAQSLSKDWQVSNTSVSQAPSWNESDQGRREGSLMLTISGTDSNEKAMAMQRKGLVDGGIGRIEAVVAGYQERLSALDRLIKKDVLEAHEEGQGHNAGDDDMTAAQ
ncbi:hypothetical protein BDV97DRAFT_398918 [Delphinella strobiligena]|nr:hypothetical protein BDV97DRAFT_398918 [Delphinella strobiligena]